jgi:glyoxylase-like metal-dependent hydrolase (beta-lactamase superfamily II)
MRRVPVFILAVSALFAAIPAPAEDPSLPFRVQRVSDRVLVFTELSPWESNHVVIVGAGGMVLVDPGHTPLMGRLIRQAVAEELGRDRFAYVIDTHGHWGHTWGNAAFPEALVIGHEQAARTIEGDRVNLERRAEFIRGQIEQSRLRLAELDPESDEARDALIERDHLDRIVRGLNESGFTIQPPRLTFSDRLTLDLGDLSLEMLFLGRGHSQSDIAVMIPEEKVLLMGCFFLDRGPLPYFGTQTVLDPERWLEVFGALLENDPDLEYVILGQHSIWPRDRLVAMRDYLAELWSEIKVVEAEGVDLETAIGRLSLRAEPSFFREVGASEEEIERYHRFEATALWRQLKDSAAGEVEKAINDGGPEAGLALYRELVAGAGADVYFDENEFNLLGYRLLGQERVDEAITVFQINVDHFPESWNVYDSLGEACALKGDTTRAIELYRRSIELNPDNANGVQAIERLSDDIPAEPAED